MTNIFFRALLFSLNTFMVVVCILVGLWSRETALENDFPHFRQHNNYLKNKKLKKQRFQKLRGLFLINWSFFSTWCARRLSDKLKLNGVIVEPSTALVRERPRFYCNMRHDCFFFRFFIRNKCFFLDFTLVSVSIWGTTEKLGPPFSRCRLGSIRL